ncbi:DUF547 domain-containing protein [Thalassobaculum sp. OXR-137]|uniref:DUF547 domain-containing protein n=1 Tax=Thalassobaculum sp. OXR-137 TaxID=3100173 RepID=UPI002AC9D008|nr:DUF547 domain-containing protein [Thalassobaculum sp. OXR-137]WPZ36432.1 DUF547 domain-containing protein [Thalassobaculum sp. OXR-137]
MPSVVTRRTLIAALAGLPAACAGGPGPEIWRRHDPLSLRVVDHRVWQVFLDRNTRDWPDGITRVDYARVSTADRELLEAYIREQSALPVASLARREQLAFWLNMHNALVVRLVLDHLIVGSPDEIETGGLFSRGPWDVPLTRVEGREVSLAGIRREVLAPVFHDPRWHYGLCDGTLGAPSLQRGAFVGADVDRRLEDAAIDYIAHPRAVDVPADRPGVVRLNALWRRHMADFGGSLQAVFASIDLYAEASLRAVLARRPEVVWMDDRRLNNFQV